MRIDVHQHFWKFDLVRDQWIDDSMAAIRRDFMPGDLAPILRENGLDGCIAVQADQSEQETIFLLDLARSNPIIRGVVGWVDLFDPKVEERLDYFSQDEKLKGIRHIVQGQPEGFMLQQDFHRGIQKLYSFGLVYEILVYANQIKEATELVKNHPDQVFVLDHLGKPGIKQGELEQWKKDLHALAELPNVHCKLSGVVSQADWNSWKYADFVPYFEVLFESFGTQRVMFGSDWPVCLVAGSYKEVLELAQQYIAQFSQGEQADIMGRTATRIYNLKS